MVRMKRPLSLAYKILLAFLAVLLPIVLAFFLGIENTRKHVEEIILDELRSVSEARAGRLDLFLEVLRNRMTDFASDGIIKNELELAVKGGLAENPALSAYLVGNKLPIVRDIDRLSVINYSGVTVASTNRSVIGRAQQGEEFFEKGLEGTTVAVRPSGLEGRPELAVASPVFGRANGRPRGAIAGFVPLEDIDDFFMGERRVAIDAAALSSGVEYRSLDIYLVGRDRLMLTRSPLADLPPLEQRVDTEAVSACFDRGRDYSGFYPDYRGIEVAGSSICMPSYGWVFITEVDREEAMRPVRDIRLVGMATFAVTAFLLSGLFAFFFRVIVRQLRRLAASSRQIAAGNYDISLPVGSMDEIGVLTSSFNDMARQVKDRSVALRASEERFRAIMDNTINIVYLKSPDGSYQFINKRYEELFRLRNEDVRGMTDHDIFPKEIADAFRANDLKALASPVPLEFEEIAPVDGHRVYISVKFRLTDAGGAPYALAGISTDITELKRSQEALRKSEASLANAQRIAHIGNWDWDIPGDELAWSDEVYRIFGLDPDEFGATYEAFIGYVHPEDREFVMREVNDAVMYGKPYSIDHRVLLSDGTEKIVHEQGEVVFDESGRPLRMSGTVQDITDRKRAEEEVIRLNEELEARVEERTRQLQAANQELESFSYSVAHDLRSPLRVIDGFSRIVLKDYEGTLDEAGRDHLQRIHGASARMGQLIDALLKLSQVMRAGLKKEDVDITALSWAVADELVKGQPSRSAEFVIAEGMTARGDASLLRLVLENLIGNAWKFTSKKEAARIEVGLETGEAGQAFFVRDNGAGFDMKYADRLFNPFQRLHGDAEFPGTGIGLATVHRIIRRHGGRIWAVGQKGQGATFYFTIQ